MLKKLFTSMIMLFLLTISMSCSKDDDADSSNGANENLPEAYINLDVTGDETGEYSSDAMADLSGTATSGYKLTIARGPGDPSNTSFQIFFQQQFKDQPSFTIPTGTYGLVPNDSLQQDDGNFAVSFINFETGTNFGYEASGTLNITKTHRKYFEGDFDFTTTSFTNGDLEVSVSGSFLALNTW